MDWCNQLQLDIALIRKYCIFAYLVKLTRQAKGKPTYVAVWREIGGEIRLVEITYVGTHEKAPY